MVYTLLHAGTLSNNQEGKLQEKAKVGDCGLEVSPVSFIRWPDRPMVGAFKTA